MPSVVTPIFPGCACEHMDATHAGIDRYRQGDRCPRTYAWTAHGIVCCAYTCTLGPIICCGSIVLHGITCTIMYRKKPLKIGILATDVPCTPALWVTCTQTHPYSLCVYVNVCLCVYVKYTLHDYHRQHTSADGHIHTELLVSSLTFCHC